LSIGRVGIPNHGPGFVNLSAMKKPIVTNCCIALIVLLFTYTASSKFMDHHRFVFQMGLAPVPFIKHIAPFLGWFIPILEASLVVGLLTDKYRRISLLGSFMLLFSFEIYIIAMMLSGLSLPCTCGGIISQMGWKQHLIFNAVFMAITLLSLLPSVFNSKNDNRPDLPESYKDLSRA
jgi:putative oxidoreductase